MVTGYFIGKATYHCTYAKKVMDIPDSDLAEEWRARDEKFGGNFYSAMIKPPIFYSPFTDIKVSECLICCVVIGPIDRGSR